MRKKLALGFALGLVLLSGCAAAEPAQQPLTFRTALLQAGGCRFTAQITANYDETVSDFTLESECDNTAGTTVCVSAPESISGIRASVSESAAYVLFDGTQLGLEPLADGALAPLAGPYVLHQCWLGAYIDTTGTEQGLLRVSYRYGYENEELLVDTWFSQQPFTPVRAQISYAGRTALEVTLSDFTMQT